MGVYGKPKDTLEARQDLWCLKERDNLHPEKTDDGRHYLSPASYTLSKEEKESVGAESDQHINIYNFVVRCDRMWPSTQ